MRGCGVRVVDLRVIISIRTVLFIIALFGPVRLLIRNDQLLAAHRALDAAVEAAYGVDFGEDEDQIVLHLFELYQAAIADE